MTGTALTTNEKKVAPYLKLNNTPQKLNEFVKNTHKGILHNQTLARRKEKAEREKKQEKISKFQEEFRKIGKNKSLDEKQTEECSTRILTRLLLFFHEPENKGKEISITEIHDWMGVKCNLTVDALKFLRNWGIIQEIKINARYFYKLSITLVQGGTK